MAPKVRIPFAPAASGPPCSAVSRLRIRVVTRAGAGYRFGADPNRGLSDAAAVAGDFGLRDLRRDHPCVERVARNVLRPGDAHAPRIQRDNLDVELLARGEVDISVLVEVSAEALRRDVIMPGRNIAIKCAAVFGSPDVAAVHVDQSKIEALGGFPGTVEPHPSLPRWDGGCHDRNRCGRPCAARRD